MSDCDRCVFSVCNTDTLRSVELMPFAVVDYLSKPARRFLVFPPHALQTVLVSDDQSRIHGLDEWGKSQEDVHPRREGGGESSRQREGDDAERGSGPQYLM